MNKVIILLGDLACGKSTYSHMLGDRYNCLVLNKDDIKERLGDTIGFKNREENKKLSNATFEIILYTFSKLAKTKQDIILEANFHDDELKRLYEEISRCSYESLTAVFKADIDILYKRFMDRIKNENRHPVHVTDDLIDFSSFKDYINKSRLISLQGKTIFIDANDFNYQNEINFANFDNFIDRFTM